MKQGGFGAWRRLTLLAGIATVVCCAPLVLARPAYAVTVDELQAKVDEATRAHDEATAHVEELQAKIDESQAKIDEVSAKLPAQREAAETSMRSMYKMQQDTPGLVSLLLSSEDFSDFITTYQYISAVQRSNDDELNELAQMERDLLNAQQTLQAAKQEADAQKQRAEATMNDAQTALNELNAQIEAQRAAEEAAARAAEEAARQQAEQENAASTEAPGTGSDTPSDPNATDGTEVETDGEWMIGSASAYSVADNTGGNATASGEELTDDSMSVAVPVSQRYLLGRTVQIRWGGKTVTARVTDVGGFAQYGRVLDLAGGVWKAFGFDSAKAWGVRTVQYRFL